MNICVTGSAGYVRLVTGVIPAEIGHRLVNVDIEAKRVARLAMDGTTGHEEGAEHLLRRILPTSWFHLTANLVDILVGGRMNRFRQSGIPVGNHHPLFGPGDAEADGEHLRHRLPAPLTGVLETPVPADRSGQGVARLGATHQPGPRASVNGGPFSRAAQPCGMKRFGVMRSTQQTR